MLTVTARSRATRQKPTEVVRGPASRLRWAWDGMLFAVPVLSADTEGLRELVGNLTPSSQVGVGWTHDEQHNVALVGDPVSDTRVVWADQPAHDRASTELTCYVRHRFNGNHDDQGGMIGQLIDPLVQPTASYIIKIGGLVNHDMRFLVAIDGTLRSTGFTSGSLTTDRYYHHFGRWRSGEPLTYDCLDDRGLVSLGGQVTSPAAHTGTITYAAGNGIRMATDEVGRQIGGQYSQVIVWRRRLTDTEIRALATDPFGWYSPRRETVLLAGPFPLIFAGASTVGQVGSAQHRAASW